MGWLTCRAWMLRNVPLVFFLEKTLKGFSVEWGSEVYMGRNIYTYVYIYIYIEIYWDICIDDFEVSIQYRYRTNEDGQDIDCRIVCTYELMVCKSLCGLAQFIWTLVWDRLVCRFLVWGLDQGKIIESHFGVLFGRYCSLFPKHVLYLAAKTLQHWPCEYVLTLGRLPKPWFTVGR